MESQEWEYVEAEFTSLHSKPNQDITNLKLKFHMLVKTKISIDIPMCYPLVWYDKQIFNSLMRKRNVSSHGNGCNSTNSNTILGDDKEIMDGMNDNNTIGRDEEEQDNQADVIVESTNVATIINAVETPPPNENYSPVNQNVLPRGEIGKLPSSTRFQGISRSMMMGKLISAHYPIFFT